MDTQRIRELLDKRDTIDQELKDIFAGIPGKKPLRCGHCQEDGHTARSCPKKSS
jgi:hypothetical protein